MRLINLAAAFLGSALLGMFACPSAHAASGSVQIEGITITAQDLDQLLSAMHQALQPNDMTIPIVISVKKPPEMPTYDPLSHYAGIGVDSKGAKALQVWINADMSSKDQQNAIMAAFFLAITDGGFAGTDFKSLYDIYAKKDSLLPAGAPDPFLYRHKFAAALVKQLNSSKP